jgi:two-component sensor histidine kinase
VINQGVNANANHQASVGIGLQLVERIANEMKWQCEILRKAQTFTVSLLFS